MTTSRPELILALNRLPNGSFQSEDDVIAFLQKSCPDVTDQVLLHRAVDFAIDRGVLARAGKFLLWRHSVTESMARDFEAEMSKAESSADPDVGTLAALIRALPGFERRLEVLERQVATLQAGQSASGAIHWLQLRMARIPRPVYDALRARALAVVGAQATEETITTQMVLVAAQILQQALQGRTSTQG